jgi:hypothetical protein
MLRYAQNDYVAVFPSDQRNGPVDEIRGTRRSAVRRPATLGLSPWM